MPELTPEQKEHIRESDRSHAVLANTFGLFQQFLSEGKTPALALQLAREAMDVWIEYEDETWIEPPEIQQPDFGQQIVDSMGKMFEKLPKGIPSWAYTPSPIPPEIGVEFVSEEPHPEVAASPQVETANEASIQPQES